MLALTTTCEPSRSNGASKRRRSRSAAHSASSRPRRSSSSTANSSPPRRATVSDGRAAALMRSAASRIRRSPLRCPRPSLTSLKSSRSIISTPTVPRPCSSAARARRSNSARLGTPVSGSVNAWRSSCSCCSRSAAAMRLNVSPSSRSSADGDSGMRWSRSPAPNARTARVNCSSGRGSAAAIRPARATAVASATSQRHQRAQRLPAGGPAGRAELRVGLVLRVRHEPLDGVQRGVDMLLEDVLGVLLALRPLPEPGLGPPQLVDGGVPLTLRAAQGGALERLVEDRRGARRDRDGDGRAIEVRQLVALALLHVVAPRDPRAVQGLQQRDARARLLHDLGAEMLRARRGMQEHGPADERADHDRHQDQGGEGEQAPADGRRAAGGGFGVGGHGGMDFHVRIGSNAPSDRPAPARIDLP